MLGGAVRVGDLFSGIGGFSLAAEWMGWSTVFFSEIDAFASRVLAHHWPDVPNYGDITRIDWTTVEPVDVLTGGFPCQPHSLAGLRKGSADERDLFDEIIRAAGVLRPRYLVLENVPGLFTSDRGRFFGRVLGAVAALGYDAEWRVLSAADVGAPHKRERVWIVADATRDGIGRPRERTVDGGSRDGRVVGLTAVESADMADAEEQSERARFRAHESRRIGQGRSGDSGRAIPDAMRPRLEGWSPSSGVRTEHADPSDARWWRTEPDVGRVAYGVPARVDRLRCLGNSIVPQCALEIFRSIEAREVATRAAA